MLFSKKAAMMLIMTMMTANMTMMTANMAMIAAGPTGIVQQTVKNDSLFDSDDNENDMSIGVGSSKGEVKRRRT